MGAPPTVSIRCPTCGADLRVVLAPSPSTQWFPCPRCHNPVPVVVPRDPPPLYTWEVVSGVYPTLPLPRRPRVRLRRLVEGALIGVAVLAVVLAGLLVVLGAQAPAPGSYVVSGTVTDQLPNGALVPAIGATVVLSDEGPTEAVQHTSPQGTFSFSGVPTGGIAINVTQSGYAPVTVDTFASSVYNAGTAGLSITLVTGNSSNATTVALSPFPDLESFLASIGSSALLLGLIAGVGAFAAVVTARSDRPAVGVVGGCAGLVAPVVLYLLALGDIFPAVLIGTAVLGGVGGFAAAARTIELFLVGPESGPS